MRWATVGFDLVKSRNTVSTSALKAGSGADSIGCKSTKWILPSLSGVKFQRYSAGEEKHAVNFNLRHLFVTNIFYQTHR